MVVMSENMQELHQDKTRQDFIHKYAETNENKICVLILLWRSVEDQTLPHNSQAYCCSIL